MTVNQPPSVASSAVLAHVVRQIVEECAPQKIILFGSRAYGTPTEDSDADLLVIVETTERPVHVAAQLAAAIDHPIALDILVRTPEDVAQRFASGDTFITDVMLRGITLYEAGDR